MRFKFFLTIVFLLSGLTVINLFAQDSTETDKEWEWHWHWEFDEFDEWIMLGKKTPTISVSYALAELAHKNFVDKFGKTGIIELKLGHTKKKTPESLENIFKYSYRYLFISNISQDLQESSLKQDELDIKSWKFGFSRSGGYGYQFGSAAIIPYFTYTHDWTRIDFRNNATNNVDQTIIDRFNKSFRFGTSNEAGIRIMISSIISFEAGYERAIIFERHLFWKWAGSAVIEFASHSVLDKFIRGILDSSPAAGPIVYLILKSALGYGLYELRQEKMNWPFSSAPPLSINDFKFGMTFTF